MKWHDQAVILSVTPFSENACRLSVLTKDYGRQSGFYQLPRRKSGVTEIVQSGDFVTLTWNARLAEHMGRFSVERTHSMAPLLFQNPQKLWLLLHMCDLLAVLPERHPYTNLFEHFVYFLSHLAVMDEKKAFLQMTLFEKHILTELGFGFDLSNCCVTGQLDDLIYISPKTARAVSRIGAGDYAQKMLPLPDFWLKAEEDYYTFMNDESHPIDSIAWGSIYNAFIVTGYFWHKWLFDEKKTFSQMRDYVVKYCKEKSNAT